MKPHTISTLEGLFVLDDTGFYVPYVEPDIGHYPRWLTIAIWAALLVGCWAFVGAVYAMGRAMMSVVAG